MPSSALEQRADVDLDAISTHCQVTRLSSTDRPLTDWYQHRSTIRPSGGKGTRFQQSVVLRIADGFVSGSSAREPHWNISTLLIFNYSFQSAFSGCCLAGLLLTSFHWNDADEPCCTVGINISKKKVSFTLFLRIFQRNLKQILWNNSWRI